MTAAAAVIDQAEHLRSLMQSATATVGVPVQQHQAAPRRRAAVVAITSGKGGVGKSNIAVNLAIKLSMAGKETVLLDADLGLANADVLCNMDLRANLSHVIGRHKNLQDVIATGPGGFGLIGGASGLARMADLSDLDRQRLVDALAELEQRADVILIDTGAGISPNVLTFTRAADHVLVVTTPEPTAITDAYAVVKVIARQAAADGQNLNDATGQRMSLLVNQVRTAGEARVVHERIAKVARQFLNVKVFDAGYVVHDDAVSDAVRRRTPFVVGAPRSAAAQCIAHLAMRLEQGVAAAPAQSGGFFERMGRWFKR